ncbi:ATP-binding protein [Acuticoccus mangrovi]|uniref:Helix-turn-helix transcriptional regulator n=1 Tax=Acuticoccus mangrovi TaxID=2796142 RepID=A0A934IIJ4_9HYPH|nr:winged helix-turn-helix domain-containing protein [Acuticoccus mangrovi]MBJ3777123.1 helix-turn-helix transcriptional regulator [Acuticoccus mangrovi]
MRDAVQEATYRFEGFELHACRRLLTRDGTPVRVGSRAMELLTILVERAGETVSKQHLMQRAWPDVFVHEDNLKVNIAGLRRLLDGDRRTSMITTVPGRGYRFVAEVRSAATEPLPLATRHADVLPSAPPLVGRAADVAAVAEGLVPGALVTVVGSGGIGKTVVAIVAAGRVLPAFVDGAAFVDLTKVNDGGLVPTVLASALGIGAITDPLASVIHALRTQTKLLIVDNCEHVLPTASAVVDQLIRDVPGLAILATSREPLAIREERLHRLDALRTAPSATHSAADALSYPAVDLFVRRAGERTGYAFTDADAAVVAELCRRIDGIPLAIELAATHTAARTVRDVLAMLDDQLRLLSDGPRRSPPRQQTLLATLDWSYNLLSDDEAAVLAALAVFMGRFDAEAALAVAPPHVAPLAVVDALARLCAKSLLVHEVRDGAITYRLLETTRAYCLERLARGGELATVRRRHAEYVCERLERAAGEWTQRRASEWGAAHGPLLDDLRSAIAWAGQGADPAPMIRLTVAGCTLWNHLSQLGECRDHAARALAAIGAAGLAGSATEMALQAALASATIYTRGLVPEAAEASQRALDLAEHLGDTETALRSLKTLATSDILTGNPLRAVARLEQFADIATADDRSALPDGERLFAIAEYYLGRFDSARRRLEHLATGARDSAGVRPTRFDIEREGVVGCALATVQWLTGFPDTAMRTAAHVVERALLSGHDLSLSNTLALACQIGLWSRRYAEAERYCEMLGELRPESNDMWRQPLMLYARGILACADGASEAGVDLIRQSIAAHESANLLVRTAHYLGTLALELANLGEIGEADRTVQAALDRAVAHNEHWCVPELLRIEALVRRRQNRADAAEAALSSALSRATEMGALSWRLRAANDLARLWLDRGRTDDVRPMLSPIVDAFTEGFEGPDLVAARGLISDRIRTERRDGRRPRSETRSIRSLRG